VKLTFCVACGSTGDGERQKAAIKVARTRGIKWGERQKEGVAKAKAAGKYKGRKPTALAKAADVRRLLNGGMPKAKIARELGIGLASVYRILSKAA
jgi:hypothetical protein